MRMKGTICSHAEKIWINNEVVTQYRCRPRVGWSLPLQTLSFYKTGMTYSYSILEIQAIFTLIWNNFLLYFYNESHFWKNVHTSSHSLLENLHYMWTKLCTVWGSLNVFTQLTNDWIQNEQLNKRYNDIVDLAYEQTVSIVIRGTQWAFRWKPDANTRTHQTVE